MRVWLSDLLALSLLKTWYILALIIIFNRVPGRFLTPAYIDSQRKLNVNWAPYMETYQLYCPSSPGVADKNLKSIPQYYNFIAHPSFKYFASRGKAKSRGHILPFDGFRRTIPESVPGIALNFFPICRQFLLPITLVAAPNSNRHSKLCKCV